MSENMTPVEELISDFSMMDHNLGVPGIMNSNRLREMLKSPSRKQKNKTISKLHTKKKNKRAGKSSSNNLEMSKMKEKNFDNSMRMEIDFQLPPIGIINQPFPGRKSNFHEKIRQQIIDQRNKISSDILADSTFQSKTFQQNNNNSNESKLEKLKTKNLGKGVMQLRKNLKQTTRNKHQINHMIDNNIQWIRDNIPVTLLRAQKHADKWRIEALHAIVHRLKCQIIGKSWAKWLEFNTFERGKEIMDNIKKSEAAKSVLLLMVGIAMQTIKFYFSLWKSEIIFCQQQENDAACVEIQRYARMYLCRSTLIDLIRRNAAICIQKNCKRYLTHLHVLEYKYSLKLTKACICIQNAYRVKRARDRVSLITNGHKREKAAVKIQNFIRGKCSRIKWIKRRQNEIQQYDAACIITRNLRCYILKILFWKARVYRKATTLQQWWQYYGRLRKYRIRNYRKRLSDGLSSIVSHLSATIIQKYARVLIARRKVEDMREFYKACVSLQSIWRGTRSRREAKEKRRNRLKYYMAACCIQRSLRSYCERRLFASIVSNTCVPLYLKALSEDEKFRQNFYIAIMHSAASCIQSFWIRYIKKKREYLALLEISALRVQCQWRKYKGRLGYHLKRQAQKQLELERQNAATKIQTVFRGRKHRKYVNSVKEANYRKHLNDSALRVQCAWRRKKGRLAVHLKRQALFFDQQRKEEAALTIQKFIRRVKSKMVALECRALRMDELTRIAKEKQLQELKKIDAVKKIQRAWRNRMNVNIGKVILTSHKLQIKRKDRKKYKRAIISDYLEELDEFRQEANFMNFKINQHEKKAQQKNDSGSTKEPYTDIEKSSVDRKILSQDEEVEELKENNDEKEIEDKWDEYWDEETESAYYYNPQTGETKW